MTLQVMLQQLSTASVAELFNITACRKLPLGIPVLSQSFGSCRCVAPFRPQELCERIPRLQLGCSATDPKLATRLQC